MRSRRVLLLALLLAAFAPLAVAQTYPAWRSAQFTPAELADPAISGPTADPDGDGISNLYEYLFVGAPLLSETHLAPTLEIVADTLALTYRERHGLAASGVRVNLEVSDLVTHWVTPNSVVEADREPFVAEGFDLVTLLDPVPLASAVEPGRRFARLRADASSPSSSLKAPTNPALSALSTTTYELRWNDWNLDETAHRVERLSPSTGLWETVGAAAADTALWRHTAADHRDGFTYRVAALRSTDNTAATSPAASLPDADGDGIPDPFELGESYAGAGGTYSTFAHLADTDGDGIPDGWEILHGLDPLNPADALADPNGNDLTNLEEYQNGNDPHLDAFGGLKPLISVISGDGQIPVSGQFLPEPMRVRIYRPDGTPWAGVPVHFRADPGEGGLAASPDDTAPLRKTLTVISDVNGYAQAWVTIP
jgi:hypothetical protein